MKVGVAVTLAGGCLVAAVVALACLGYLFPLSHEKASKATNSVERYERIRVGLLGWQYHGAYECWKILPDGEKRPIQAGEYRRGKKFGMWQTWDENGGLVLDERFDDAGTRLLKRSYRAGLLRHEVTEAVTDGVTSRETRVYADDGVTVAETRLEEGGRLAAIDGVRVTMERQPNGRLDRAVHRSTTDDGKKLEITYHFDRSDTVREIVRVIDGTEVERIRPPVEIPADMEDTYDFEKHTWKD
ncbi:MAG TPA: hypothetical protein VEL07_00430 [Planctomycetota bacterium]|nr:hypothetical protein [Planctomycetota bacterium]